MIDEMQALGRRWAALGLEWLPGMLACGPWRVLTVATDGYPMSMFATAHHHPRGWWGLAGQPGAAREVIPDFSDRLTELALLVHVQPRRASITAACRFGASHAGCSRGLASLAHGPLRRCCLPVKVETAHASVSGADEQPSSGCVGGASVP